MKWGLFAAIAVVVLEAGSAGARETWREQSRLDLEPRDISGIEVHNARGRIEARPSADGRVHVTALKIVRARDRDISRRLARETLVETSRQGGRLVIRVRYPQRHSVRINFWDSFSDISIPRVEVRIALEIPSGLPLWLNETSGDVITENHDGRQVIKTTSGDVEVHGARGPLEVTSTSGDVSATGVERARVSTISGDVEIAGVRGALSASTSSGDVSVENARDSLTIRTTSGEVRTNGAVRGASVRTASGDIRIEGASGQVHLGSTSGEVVVGLRDPLARADVETASGDIVVELAGTLACTLDMRTSSGSIDVDLPVETRTVSRHAVTAVVRNGRTPVVLGSTSGNIQVRGGNR